jgi:hypothetical protein
MSSFMTYLALIVYCALALACAVIAYGRALDWMWRDLPVTRKSKETKFRMRGIALWISLSVVFLPFILLILYLPDMNGRGLMYRFPKS